MKPRKDICDAIKNRRIIEFVYHSTLRVGNPQCYGLTRTGKEAIRVHLTKGGKRPEQLFTLDKVSNFKVLEEQFTSPGPNYHKGDLDLPVIFCEL